jgi:ABC-type nickel/cobalt efflux system permease component RcnA
LEQSRQRHPVRRLHLRQQVTAPLGLSHVTLQHRQQGAQLLARFSLRFSRQLDVEGLEPWFQLATGVIIVGIVGQTLTLEISRPDGTKQVFEFTPQGDCLESAANIPEPHEFNVGLKASSGGYPITYYTSFVEHHHHSHGTSQDGFQDAHEREHAQQLQSRFAGQSVTTRQVVLFGLTVKGSPIMLRCQLC